MGQARDYEALIRELLAGVAAGGSYGDVIVLLMTKGVDESDLALLLRDFAEGLSLEQDGELIEQLKLLGKMTPGKLASEAFSIAARLDSSYEPNSELLNQEAWYSRGVELGELEQYEEAIEYYDRAIELQPDYCEAWHGRGAALYNLGQSQRRGYNRLRSTHKI
jgi:tetratricopeptide (TPR) repeat protein